MSDLVPGDEIERIVGTERHPTRHLGRAVGVEAVIYILHSADCLRVTPDLRDCPYSRALDRGIEYRVWEEYLDRPVILMLQHRRLAPDIGPKVKLR